MLSERQKFVLAALSAAGRDDKYAPVDVQKMFFLLDREASAFHGGPKFNFDPYDFGPFDKQVYEELEALKASDLIEITSNGRHKEFALTPTGKREAEGILQRFDAKLTDYMARLGHWVLDNDFSTIVSEIYKKYPEMKAKSVFRG